MGVLALLALFTHNHIFWIAALLLALVQFPNFSAPLASMAESLERLAGRAPPAGAPASIPGAEVTRPEAVPTKSAAATTTPLGENEPAPAAPEKVA